MNFPNTLSLSRIVLLIPIIISYENSFYLSSVLIFILASVTDYLDGYFARKNNQASDFGALLDLLADKIFVCVMLIWMVFSFNNFFILIATLLIVTREIMVSYLRLFIVSRSMNLNEVKPDIVGKIKTTLQMIGLGLVLISPLLNDLVFSFSIILLILSSIFSWFSFLKYSIKWYEKKN